MSTEAVVGAIHDGGVDVYRLTSSIAERDGLFHVRVAASIDSRLHGSISRERVCDSRQAAEITEALLMEQIRAAVRAIGAALDVAESGADGAHGDDESFIA